MRRFAPQCLAFAAAAAPCLAAVRGAAPFSQEGSPPAASTAGEHEDATAVRARREAAFERLLTNVDLVGFTTLSTREGLQPDSYTLRKVSKEPDGRFKFEAIIHYGTRPIPIAMSLPVEWAGDTPVISVTGLTVPFMGKYDARVLFHGDQYVGVWEGDGYGGHIFGKVVPRPPVSAEPSEPGEPAPEERGAPPKNATPDDSGAPPEAPRQEEAAAPLQAPSGRAGADVGRAATDWPQYRGPGASGLAEGYALPASFDLASGENVRWRVPVQGLAHSSPVIHGDDLLVTTAVRVDGEQELRVGLYGDTRPIDDASEFRFELLCFDKRTGAKRWEKLVWQGVPAIKRHPKGSHAASTPAVDAERIVVFLGSEGLHCFDRSGELLWRRDFGVLDSGWFVVKTHQWGFASSPVLHEGKVVVQCDVQEGSFLAVLDGRTGEDVWRVPRKEVPGWSTPTVHVGAERAQIVCNGWKHIGGYDLADGTELWRAAPGGDIPVPTPVVAHDLVYITNAHGMAAPILAIDLAATGRVSFAEEEKKHLAWGTTKRGNYMQTPIVYGDYAYFCSDPGILKCFDARTGVEHYAERLDEGRSGYTSSPVGGDGKLYFTSEEGVVVTVKAGKPELEVLARSALGEEHMATPAISAGTLYFRTRGHLTAVALP